MKNVHREPDFYFSAYPLKALNLPEEEKKSYLNIYTNSDKKIKRPQHSKVLPMINPYPEHRMEAPVKMKNKPSDQIEERESDWFASYE